MKKIFVFILFAFYFVEIFSQQNYPIRTIFKGDSVVILTTKQSNFINSRIENTQRQLKISQEENLLLTEENELLKSCNQDLKEKNERQQFLIDSLKSIQVTKLDTFINQSNNGWMINASVNNNYLHIDWSDTTIKWIDLNIHKSGELDHLGYVRILRNDNKISVYNLGSPNDYYFNKKTKGPIIYQYPFRFTFKSEEKIESIK